MGQALLHKDKEVPLWIRGTPGCLFVIYVLLSPILSNVFIIGFVVHPLSFRTNFVETTRSILEHGMSLNRACQDQKFCSNPPEGDS